MPTARVDITLYIADRNDSRQISLLMNTCCEFFSWPKFLMSTLLSFSDRYYSNLSYTISFRKKKIVSTQSYGRKKVRAINFL